MTICPSEATLRLIGTEAIGDATFAGLEGHVERCLNCQKILDAETRAVPPTPDSEPAQDILPTVPGLVIERKLGRGGTSAVYLAWDPTLKRHVAVKLYPKNSLVDRHAREHWLSEARALSRVSHDHVVVIHRVDETGEWLSLVIEYVSGGTLKDRMTEPLAPRDAARLTETIARTVGYFHGRGVCHLDLKPSNILLEGDAGAPWEALSPKISDFGIASLEGEPGTTETGANGPKGTPSYMAPEQVAAIPGTIGPAADIHALGALLYHLLTGRAPFEGASSTCTLEIVRNQDPVPPRQLNGRIPRDLETICLKCLEKAPARRYRTAIALADDVRLWLDGRPIKARRVSPLGHAWRCCRRHPAVAVLMVALAITFATGFAGLFVLLKHAEVERARLAEALSNAEAYKKFSASAADQLGSFLRTTIRFKRSTTPDQMTAALLRLGNSTSELRNRGILPSATIGFLEEEIGSALASFNKIEEARDLLKQSISDLTQSAARNPADKDARLHLGEALELSGVLAEAAGQFEDALSYYEQEAANRMAFEPSLWKFNCLTDLYRRLQLFANQFEQSDQSGQKERSLRLSQEILHHLVGSDPPPATSPSAPGPETLSRLVQLANLEKMSSDEDKRDVFSIQSFVFNWLAVSLGTFSPFESSSCAVKFDRDPEAGAIALIAAARDRCSQLDLAASVVPMAISVVSFNGVYEAARQRRLGRVDDAAATVARLMTLARRLVREYPDSARAYRLLSEAHNQIRKNAFKTDDDNLMLESLVQAIAVARRALALDSNEPEIRRHLDKLTQELASVEVDRKTAGSTRP